MFLQPTETSGVTANRRRRRLDPEPAGHVGNVDEEGMNISSHLTIKSHQTYGDSGLVFFIFSAAQECFLYTSISIAILSFSLPQHHADA